MSTLTIIVHHAYLTDMVHFILLHIAPTRTHSARAVTCELLAQLDTGHVICDVSSRYADVVTARVLGVAVSSHGGIAQYVGSIHSYFIILHILHVSV